MEMSNVNEANAVSEKSKKAEETKKNSWLKYSDEQKKEVEQLNNEYKHFISKCKTERECTNEIVLMAKELGYNDLMKTESLKSGDKVYYVNMDKTVVLFNIGSEPLSEGMKLLGAHIDSPRLDLKQVPLYEDTEMAMLDTHYYGGIKKYQWVTIPLALHGVVVKKDGTKLSVVIGEDEDDPVLGITDLLIHLAADQMDKKASKVVEGEELNILIGSMPLKGEEKEAVKTNIINILKDKYGFDENDFISAEFEAVPAGKARDFGIDRSMVMGYGHDDRVCAYTSAKALFNLKETKKTAVCILVDKEEIGSVGATGMSSMFFENTVAEILERLDGYSGLKLRRALQNSVMLSSDVSAAYDPNYPLVNEKKNTAYLNKGLVINKYTGRAGKSGCNDANPEFIAKLRNAFENNNVSFQTSELGKVDQGGGGTIAYIMAKYNMQVVDSGVPVLNMHAPWEIVSKSDVYEAFKGYEAFLKDVDNVL